MARLVLACLALFAASASAYQAPALRPVAARSAIAKRAPSAAPAAVRMAEYKWPASETLGIGKSVPSKMYALSSLVCLGIGLSCTAQSNIFNILSAESVNPALVLGSTLTLYSFFLHVACYVQMKNGKKHGEQVMRASERARTCALSLRVTDGIRRPRAVTQGILPASTTHYAAAAAAAAVASSQRGALGSAEVASHRMPSACGTSVGGTENAAHRPSPDPVSTPRRMYGRNSGVTEWAVRLGGSRDQERDALSIARAAGGGARVPVTHVSVTARSAPRAARAARDRAG
eukprot:CAMPEP_0185187218 /NCGR_PEP_ID=MMETSP1140-20130426/4585_1 /TAXON_ID=298111 /ORGANISM="Pavlova sp., Strain CCMP459" /LENGTH=288 /DNA_ID=CAMNT_0027753579 /DNA_START=32 /DNA_END=900 /DNA_ORIENTATION=-